MSGEQAFFDRRSAVFDAGGRHLRTVDTLRGNTLETFAYDAAGRLVSITDHDGRVTSIQRDGSGKPTAIVAPGGDRTELFDMRMRERAVEAEDEGGQRHPNDHAANGHHHELLRRL